MSKAARKPNPLGQFQCPACKAWKFPHEFYETNQTKAGISTYCKPCHKARQREYRVDIPEDVRRERFERAVSKHRMYVVQWFDDGSCSLEYRSE